MCRRQLSAILCAVLLGLLTWSGGARAAELTHDELSYLEEEFGLCRGSSILTLLTPAEKGRIRDIFSFVKPWAHIYPYILQVRVFGVLDAAYTRQCQEWSHGHRATPCPPVPEPAHQSGKDLADFQCNACHLFGTPDAPGFFRLAREGRNDIAFLSEALESGHRMSPINLTPDELKALSGYIGSLSCKGRAEKRP